MFVRHYFSVVKTYDYDAILLTENYKFFCIIYDIGSFHVNAIFVHPLHDKTL